MPLAWAYMMLDIAIGPVLVVGFALCTRPEFPHLSALSWSRRTGVSANDCVLQRL